MASSTDHLRRHHEVVVLFLLSAGDVLVEMVIDCRAMGRVVVSSPVCTPSSALISRNGTNLLRIVERGCAHHQRHVLKLPCSYIAMVSS